jgi:hypothetical protein
MRSRGAWLAARFAVNIPVGTCRQRRESDVRIRWTTRFAAIAGVIWLTVAVTAAGGGTARAAQIGGILGQPRAVTSPAGYTVAGGLSGVAATSAGDAWAVGYSGSVFRQKTLILHWNGRAWARSPGFTPAAGALLAVAAVSRSSAWAAGFTGGYGKVPARTLLLHWNGGRWSAVTRPAPADGALSTVTATPAYAFAGGSTASGKGLIWRWDGKGWATTRVPAIPGGGGVNGIAARSAASAWAGGDATESTQISDMLMRWNGAAWSLVPRFPIQGRFWTINGMAEGRGGTAWAVGSDADTLTNAAISMYFNGRAWVKVPSPKNAAFVAVTAVPGGTAWAGGESYQGSAVVPLLERWTGRSWARTASPALGGSVQLGGVAATSPGNAWAVGFRVNGSDTKTFILRWNDRAWR